MKLIQKIKIKPLPFIIQRHKCPGWGRNVVQEMGKVVDWGRLWIEEGLCIVYCGLRKAGA